MIKSAGSIIPSSIPSQHNDKPVAHDVFISYSSKDKVTADAVCARLEARGIRCWIAPRDVHPGLPYGEEIIDAIQGCRLMVLVFSANANASPHIPKEIERAVSHGIPVIPVRVEAVAPAKSLDYFISSVHWLDAITPPLEQHLESLANTVLKILPTRPLSDPAKTHKASAPVASPPVMTRSPSAKTADLQNASAGQKNKGFFITIGAIVLVAIAVGVYLWLRPGETQSAAANPLSQPANPNLPPAFGVPAGSDPIAGCWQWFNNVPITINADGSVIAGPFTEHWRGTDRSRHSYTITWPEAVDNLTLSGDGGTLSGANQ
jgi:TIR domain